MSILDMSAAFSGLTQTVTLKTATTTTVDFVPTTVVTSETISAVIQVVQDETLKALDLDWSLRYFYVHSVSAMDVGQYIEYGGVDYKIVRVADFSDYNYYEAIIEEVKGDII